MSLFLNVYSSTSYAMTCGACNHLSNSNLLQQWLVVEVEWVAEVDYLMLTYLVEVAGKALEVVELGHQHSLLNLIACN